MIIIVYYCLIYHPFFHQQHEKVLQIPGGGVNFVFFLLMLSLLGTKAQAQDLKNSAQAITAASPLSSNTIHYKGPLGTTGLNTRFDPLDLCPNPVDQFNGAVSNQPYQFEFQSNCVGENAGQFNAYHPPFIWSLSYTTENGHYYNEQWEDLTNNDYSKVVLYAYDRIPYGNTRSNGTACFNSGFPNIHPWAPNNTGNVQTNATTGELITKMTIECTGYQCGFSGGNDHDIITVRYKGNRPQNLVITGNPAQICRSQPYTINWDPSFGATGYVVQTSVGTISTSGTSAQLLLPATTPNTVTSVTITVGAQNGCGGPVPASSVTTLTLPVTPAPPAPTNMQLTNGLCPTSSGTDKSVTITKVGNAEYFEWSISGPGAYFTATNSQTYTQPIAVNQSTGSATIQTPQVGTVTVICQQRTACGGLGNAIATSYQIAWGGLVKQERIG